MDDDLPPELSRVLNALRDDAGPDIVRIGSIPEALLGHWVERTTLEVIIPRERRRHYLERHPEVLHDEVILLSTLVSPAEIHRNTLDERIAIFYTEIGDGFYLRVPIWISDHTDRQNSVLSLRRARAKEVEAGRVAGRRVWKKMR